MIWKLALLALEIARILAAREADTRSENAALAKVLVKQIENANAKIAKARDARATANAGGVRDPDRYSRQ